MSMSGRRGIGQSSPSGKFATFWGKNRGASPSNLVFSKLISLKSLGHVISIMYFYLCMSSERALYIIIIAYIYNIYIYTHTRVEETQSHVRGLLTTALLASVHMLLHGSKVVWGDGELYALPPHVYAGFGYCPRDVLPLPRSEETIIFHIGLWTNDAVDPTSSFDPGGYSNTLWYQGI